MTNVFFCFTSHRVDGVFLQRFQCTGSILPAAPPTGNGFRSKRRGDSKLRPAVDRFLELFRLLLFYRRATSHCCVQSTFFSRVIVGSRHASQGRGVRKEGWGQAGEDRVRGREEGDHPPLKCREFPTYFCRVTRQRVIKKNPDTASLVVFYLCIIIVET